MKKNEVIGTVNRAANNNKNNFAVDKKAVKIDLGTIAEIMANKNNGFISEDLFKALKMAEAAGLGSEDKPLPEFIPTEEKELNYEERSISEEMYVILMLRAKAGDNDALTKLFLAKKPLIDQATKHLYRKYASAANALETELDYYEAVAYEAFLIAVLEHPICSFNNIAQLSLSYTLSDEIGRQFSYSTRDPFRGSNNVAFNVRRKMTAEGFEVRELTEEQYIDFCTSRKICSAVSAKKAYSAYWSNNQCFTEAPKPLEAFEDDKAEETMDNVIELVDTASGKKDFVSILIKLREDEKHGRDIETLITHVLGEKNFAFNTLYAINASDRESLAKTAEIMGYESEYEVKLAIKRAREFVFKYIKRNNPELFEMLTAERKVSKIK